MSDNKVRNAPAPVPAPAPAPAPAVDPSFGHKNALGPIPPHHFENDFPPLPDGEANAVYDRLKAKLAADKKA